MLNLLKKNSLKKIKYSRSQKLKIFTKTKIGRFEIEKLVVTEKIFFHYLKGKAFRADRK